MIKLVEEENGKLYFLQDSQWFKKMERNIVSEYLNKGYVPTKDELISNWMNDDDMYDNMKEWEDARSNMKVWRDIKSVDSFADHIINLISANIHDYDESFNRGRYTGIIKEEVKEDKTVEQLLKNISHWASAIDRIYAKSKEFKDVLYDFTAKNRQAHNVTVDKLSEFEKRLRAIYKEMSIMEEKILEDRTEE